MSRSISILLGFVAAGIVCYIEYIFTATAWGGPFTILIGIPIASAFISGVCVVAAALVGLLLRLPGLRGIWERVGYRVVFIPLIPILIIAFSKSLGLRSTEPISGYSVMSPWVGFTCYFFIAFPLVNFPVRRKLTSPPPYRGV